MMRALVTGACGFVGRHLIARLRSLRAEVIGIDIASRSLPGGTTLVTGDVAETALVSAVVAAARPTHVFHLAGVLAAPGADPWRIFEGNVRGTVGLLEALKDSPCRVLVASSGAVYGRQPDGPIAEGAPLRPITAYGASKAGQEMVAMHYAQMYRMPIVTARTFNLIGPGQPAVLMASSVARQIAEIELGVRARVLVGDLDPCRDYVDVRDAVRAYVSLIDVEAGVYNVCSGQPTSCRSLVDRLSEASTAPIEVEVDASRVRPSEVRDQVGDPARLRRATGWTPEFSIRDSLRDLLEWWRVEAARERNAAQ